MDGVVHEYVAWLQSLVYSPFAGTTYDRLFNKLYETPFVWYNQPVLNKDGTRAERGIQLRSEFCAQKGYTDAFLIPYIGLEDCSVLEMLIGLSLDIEWLAEDDDLGDRTGLWFWAMISNLGLTSETDDTFHEGYVDEVLRVFLQREYDGHGIGGLFYVQNPLVPLNKIDIWMQAMYFLTSIDDDE